MKQIPPFPLLFKGKGRDRVKDNIKKRAAAAALFVMLWINIPTGRVQN
jgi:hypothetical protein